MRRVAFLVALAVVVGWPALESDPGDGFPVSSYPMFARDRDRVVSIATAVGLDAAGGEHRLGPGAIGGGDEPMLAASAARRAVAAGAEEIARFCAEVAGRVPAGRDVVTVEIRTEVRDAVDDVTADEPPIEVRVHARCQVPA